MTIILTKPVRVGGVELAAATTQTFAADVEADLVARGSAAYTINPTIGQGGVPVMADINNLTGGIGICKAGSSAVSLTASVECKADGNDEVLISAALAANKRVRIISNAVISSAIVINSGNVLEVENGVTIKLKDGVINGPMLQNKSAAESVRQSTASITAGSTTLTDATITTADIGRSVIVRNAGHGGTEAIPTLLCAVIISASTGQATLSAAASLTVSGAVSTYYNRDTDITVIGGLWDFNNGNNPGSPNADGYYNSSHMTKFRRVDGLMLKGMTFKSNAGKYGINLADVTDYRVENPTFNTFSDGCHVSGPAYNGVISGMRGTTGDDYIGLTARDYKYYSDTQGDIVGLSVTDTVMSNTSAGRLLLLGGPGCIVDNIFVNGIYGLCRGVYSGSGLADVNCAPMFNSIIGDVIVKNVSVTCPAGYCEVHVASESLRSLLIDNVGIKNKTNGHQYILIEKPVERLAVQNISKSVDNTTTGQIIANVTSTATINSLSISSISVRNAATKYINSVLSVACPVTSLEVSGFLIENEAYTTSSNALLKCVSGANVASLILANGTAKATKYLFEITSGVTLGNVVFNAVRATGCSRLIETSSALDVTLVGVSIASPYSEAINVLAGASLTVKGAGCYFDPAKDGVSRAGSEVVRVMNMDFPVDSAKVASNAADRHYNTNVASGPLKVGPCIYNGAEWKSLLNIA